MLRPAAVVCRGLVATLNGRPVLDGVDLVVPVGARLLIVGQPPEAASLLLRVLAGLAHPERGTVRLAGLARQDDSSAGWARRVAYVGPAVRLYPWLAPSEALDLAGRLAGYDRAERGRRTASVAERYRISAAVQRPLSRGGAPLQQRTELAAALIGDPEVILLDDPLRAIEPPERERLLRMPGKRRTVLLASAFPASEASVVDQVVLLRGGRVVLHAPIAELERRGLPLSLPGVEALADHRAGLQGTAPAPDHPMSLAG